MLSDYADDVLPVVKRQNTNSTLQDLTVPIGKLFCFRNGDKNAPKPSLFGRLTSTRKTTDTTQ